jgi:hypothetical protein
VLLIVEHQWPGLGFDRLSPPRNTQLAVANIQTRKVPMVIALEKPHCRPVVRGRKAGRYARAEDDDETTRR